MHLHPISQFGMVYCSPSTSPATTEVLDLDNIMQPLFNTVHKPITIQPGILSVALNSAPQLAQLTSEDHLDDITMALTVNTRLSALKQTCALLPAILKKLEALSPPPTTNTISGSTSTLTVSATLSAQGSTLGGRD